MGDQSTWMMWISIGFLAGGLITGFLGLITGYFVGYRNGAIAGELAALKFKLHRTDHDGFRRRSKRSNDESQVPQAGSPTPDH